MDDLEAWLAFRRNEHVERKTYICTECKQPIPPTNDVIEWDDGSGRICENCAI